MTGSPVFPSSLRQMLSVRQSSLCGCRDAGSTSSKTCIAEQPNASQTTTSSESSSGSAGFHRRPPTGGFAYGMPKNASTPPSSDVPRMTPVRVFTSIIFPPLSCERMRESYSHERLRGQASIRLRMVAL